MQQRSKVLYMNFVSLNEHTKGMHKYTAHDNKVMDARLVI
jgi:hypothetical protein